MRDHRGQRQRAPDWPLPASNGEHLEEEGTQGWTLDSHMLGLGGQMSQCGKGSQHHAFMSRARGQPSRDSSWKPAHVPRLPGTLQP